MFKEDVPFTALCPDSWGVSSVIGIRIKRHWHSAQSTVVNLMRMSH